MCVSPSGAPKRRAIVLSVSYRRELAVYSSKDELMYHTWIDVAEVEAFTASRRAQGFRVIDVEKANQFVLGDYEKQPDPTDRLRHILGSPLIPRPRYVTRKRR